MTMIIPRNTKLQTSKSEVFSTTVDGQTSVEINVIQGGREFVRDNKSLGSFRLDDILAGPRGVPQIKVEFDIDANGILSVSTVDKGAGKKQAIIITFASTLPSDEAPVDHEESVDRPINVESSVNWEQQSPSDIQEIMKRSRYDVLAMNKSELIDKLLTTGVLIDNGEKHFSLSKVNRKKCHMLPAKAVINKSPYAEFTKCSSSTMSRFEEVVELQRHQAFSIKCDIETKTLSPDTAYACNLVFQLPQNSEGLKCPVKARDLLNKNNKEDTIIYLRAPGPIDLYKDKRVPEIREDGWMEVRVWEFIYNNEIKDNYIPMELKLVCLGGTMAGLTVCGVEFRPL